MNPETSAVGAVEFTSGAATHVGHVRGVNEDAYLATRPVFLVADGMGGHEAGEVASALVVDEFSPFVGRGSVAIDDVVSAIERANGSIFRRDGDLAGGSMGTTVVGLVVVDNGGVPALLLFNVGDSRAYRWSAGTFEQLSTDHSVVQELVDNGSISPAQARAHPERNVVTRALGPEARVKADLWVFPCEVGDRFLLCSDGLHGEVDDASIEDVIVHQPDPERCAVDLVEAALVAGGRDNVTVVVVDVIAGSGDPDVLVDDTLGAANASRPDETTNPRPVAPTLPEAEGAAVIDEVPGV